MKMRLIGILFALFAPAAAMASGAEVHLDKANIDLHNQAALQRGAKYFVNYCMGCHSAAYQRYNRMGRDLGIPDELVQQNLIFTRDEKGAPTKIGALMTNAMHKGDAKEWFGAAPPDLTLVARVRGADWLYTYLRSFYKDPSRPFGVNNTVFANVGMPHVLWQLQGMQEKVVEKGVDAHGHEHETTKLVLVQPGSMSPTDYDQMVRDLVTFLAYLGEPAQLKRQQLGVYVLLFLFVFFVVAYYLKKEYWKDVH